MGLRSCSGLSRIRGRDMVTPFQMAAELADAAAGVQEVAADTAFEAAEEITDRWQQVIPSSPGGYEGAGFTSSPGANKAARYEDGGRVGAEAVNWSFVASFLQSGTAHHGPKVDLFGAAEPSVNRWVNDLADEVGL